MVVEYAIWGFSLKKFHLCFCDSRPFSYSVQVSLPYSRVSTDGVLNIRNLVCFLTLEGFKTWLTIPVICKNCDMIAPVLINREIIKCRKNQVSNENVKCTLLISSVGTTLVSHRIKEPSPPAFPRTFSKTKDNNIKQHWDTSTNTILPRFGGDMWYWAGTEVVRTLSN